MSLIPSPSRKKDVFWLRLAAIDEPGFYPGVPWLLCPNAFGRLERCGLVNNVPNMKGPTRAIATDLGKGLVEDIRKYNLARAEACGEETP